MKKLLLLAVLLCIAGTGLMSQELFGPVSIKDTVAKTVSAVRFDTVQCGMGNKSLEIWNLTGGTLYFGFDDYLGKKDTINIVPIFNGNKRTINFLQKERLYLKSTVSGTALIVNWEGFALVMPELPINSSGQLVTSTTLPAMLADSTSEFADSSRAFHDTITASTRVDTASRKNLSGSNTLYGLFQYWYQVQISTDDTLEYSTQASFPANNLWTIYPGGWTSAKYAVSQITNFYIRNKGMGLATIAVKYDGN